MAKKAEPSRTETAVDVEVVRPTPVPFAEHWRAVHNFLAGFSGLEGVRAALEAARDAEAAVAVARADAATLEAGIDAAAQDFRALEAKIVDAKAILASLATTAAAERTHHVTQLNTELVAQRTAALATREAEIARLDTLIATRTARARELAEIASQREAELAAVEAKVAEANRQREAALARLRG